MPLIFNYAAPASAARRVNAPYFSGGVLQEQTAIFWFGNVTPTENYADVRIGYTNSELYVRLNIFDRLLWYDTDPSPEELTAWDAVSLFLDLNGNVGAVPDANAYRFVVQLSADASPPVNWQTAYRGNGAGWTSAAIAFTNENYYRGGGYNTVVDNRGWFVVFHIPFTSVGLSAAPPQGTIWGLGLSLHDRDSATGSPPIADKVWPQTLLAAQPATWGQLFFGLPTYSPPPSTPGSSVSIRHENGVVVTDGMVGGSTTCGATVDPNFFDGWGDLNYAGLDYFNIQNQSDVADWPCFSKYYVTFPLNALPSSKIIVSATLTLYQFGNAGVGHDPGPQPSLIQVLTVREDWNEQTLTWNNAPWAMENIGGAWVDPLTSDPPFWWGAPREWDVSRAVADAYARGEPLRLALYSADAAYHSGKYFRSSDYYLEGRPVLQVLWGDP